MVFRLYYVGLLKDKRPEICPSFFQVDFAPLIVKFLYSFDGEHWSIVSIVIGETY